MRTESRAHEALQLIRVIARDAEINRLGADLSTLRGDRVRVRRHDATAGGIAVGFDQLVAARQDRDARALMDGDVATTERCEHAERRGAESHAGIEHRLAGAHVFASAAQILSGHRGRCEPRARPVAHDVFLSHDGVGARRNRRAGKDSRDLPRRERAIRRAACRHLERNRQRHRRRRADAGEIAAVHRVAVHRRDVERRQRAPRNHRLGEHPALGVGGRAGFGWQRQRRVEDQPLRFGSRELGAHRRPS